MLKLANNYKSIGFYFYKHPKMSTRTKMEIVSIANKYFEYHKSYDIDKLKQYYIGLDITNAY